MYVLSIPVANNLLIFGCGLGPLRDDTKLPTFCEVPLFHLLHHSGGLSNNHSIMALRHRHLRNQPPCGSVCVPEFKQIEHV